MIVENLILFLVCYVAGILSSLVGIGGGMVIIPILTTFFHIDLKCAIALSLLAVIGTSSSSSIEHLKHNIINIRIASLLQIPTSLGSILGALLFIYFKAIYIYILLLLTLFYSLFSSIKSIRNNSIFHTENDYISRKLKLNGKYYDNVKKRVIFYNVKGSIYGMIIMFFAGFISAILGIGSGMFKVLAMDNIMKIPIKVSTSTSNFMIGVTAASSTIIYFLRGYIDPKLLVPIVLGAFLGSKLGGKILHNIDEKLIRILFISTIMFSIIQLLNKIV